MCRRDAHSVILLIPQVETDKDQSKCPPFILFPSELSIVAQITFILNTNANDSLHGLFGRKTGQVEGFQYTDANKQKGITW